MVHAKALYPNESIPPLETGDHLSMEEFHRLWDLHPEIKKAELINGMVFVELSVSARHGEPHARAITWMGVYCASHRELQALDNATVRLGDDSLQPDVLLRRREHGTSLVSVDSCIEGPPELAGEISATSASFDMNAKKEVYRRGGVQEYLVWQHFEKRIDWWELREGEYVPLEPDADGVIESRVFPGLRLDVAAMVEGDMAAVLAALNG